MPAPRWGARGCGCCEPSRSRCCEPSRSHSGCRQADGRDDPATLGGSGAALAFPLLLIPLTAPTRGRERLLSAVCWPRLPRCAAERSSLSSTHPLLSRSGKLGDESTLSVSNRRRVCGTFWPGGTPRQPASIAWLPPRIGRYNPGHDDQRAPAQAREERPCEPGDHGCPRRRRWRHARPAPGDGERPGELGLGQNGMG